jgi:hypothetical protein
MALTDARRKILEREFDRVTTKPKSTQIVETVSIFPACEHRQRDKAMATQETMTTTLTAKGQ